MRLLGISKVKQALKKAERKYGPSGAVLVGYTANYAMQVHERVKTKRGKNVGHQVGQAKFLEQPARELAGELGDIVLGAVRGGATLPDALLLAGHRLQRASQELVPVDTGNLKGSAFTELE